MPTGEFTIGGIQNRVSNARAELPGARFEVETLTGPSGGPQGKSVTTEQLAEVFGAGIVAPNHARSLLKAFRYRTRAEVKANGDFGESLEDLLYDTCCIQTQAKVELYQDADLTKPRIGGQVLVAVFDGSATPAGYVYVDGSFKDGELIPAKFVPIESPEAKYGYVRRDTSPATIKDWHFAELSIWSIAGADQFATAKQAGGPWPAFTGVEDAYWAPAAAPTKPVPSLLSSNNRWTGINTYEQALFLAALGAAPDLGLRRSAAGVLEINTGVAGSPATVSAMDYVAQAAPAAYNSFTKLVNKVIANEVRLGSTTDSDPAATVSSVRTLSDNLATLAKYVIRWDQERFITLNQVSNTALKYVSGRAYAFTSGAYAPGTIELTPPTSDYTRQGDYFAIRIAPASTDLTFQCGSLRGFGSATGPTTLAAKAGQQYFFHAVVPDPASTAGSFWQVHSTPSTGSGTSYDDTALKQRIATLEAQGGRQRGPWAATTDYKQYDMVVQAGVPYYANATFTSGASFDASKWTSLLPLASTSAPGVVQLATAGGIRQSGTTKALRNEAVYFTTEQERVYDANADVQATFGAAYALTDFPFINLLPPVDTTRVGFIAAFRNRSATQVTQINTDGPTIDGQASLALAPGQQVWIKYTTDGNYQVVLRTGGGSSNGGSGATYTGDEKTIHISAQNVISTLPQTIFFKVNGGYTASGSVDGTISLADSTQGAGFQTVPFTEVVENIRPATLGDGWDADSHTFTIQQDGLYELIGKFRLRDGNAGGPPSGQSYGMGVNVGNNDGSDFSWFQTFNTRNSAQINTSRRCVVGDKIRLYVYLDSFSGVCAGMFSVRRLG